MCSEKKQEKAQITFFFTYLSHQVRQKVLILLFYARCEKKVNWRVNINYAQKKNLVPMKKNFLESCVACLQSCWINSALKSKLWSSGTFGCLLYGLGLYFNLIASVAIHLTLIDFSTWYPVLFVHLLLFKNLFQLP